jgi:hypothetical protein
VTIAASILFGLWTVLSPAQGSKSGGQSDLALYRAVIERVRHGEPYELAAVAEHRARRYPVKPFVAVRPPVLALALARLPREGIGDVALGLLAALTAGCWIYRLRREFERPLLLALAAVAIVSGVVPMMVGGGASLFHEAWAGLLIALSLAVRTERRFVLAVALGLLAAIIRELALPYLGVMALLALLDRRRLEALTFAAATAIALGVLTLHARGLALVVTPQDLPSPGWASLGGWSFVLSTASWNMIAVLAGAWSTAWLVPLALTGAAGWKGPAGLRLIALLGGYTLGFMAIGRPDNLYWGMMVSPLIAVGLSLAPAAVADLARRTRALDATPLLR